MLKLQEELHQRLLEARRTYEDAERRLKAALEGMTKPLLLTEGKTDVQILKTAWEKLHPDMEIPWKIEPCDNNPNSEGGAGGYTKLQVTLEGVRPDAPHVVIGLFDRDSAGISGFGKLSKNFAAPEGDTDVKVHSNRRAIAILLPTPPGREEFARLKNLPIEYYFPEEALRRRTAGGLGLELKLEPVVSHWRGTEVTQHQPNELRYHTVKGGKEVFAEEIVPNLPVEDFSAFNVLFDLILKYVNS